MKRIVAIFFTILIGCTMFAGCSTAPEEVQEPPVVYSFSGENEQFKISNGVIVLTSTEDILYGGDLEEKQGNLSDVTAFTITFYVISGDEKEVLLSNRVVDMTGKTVTIPGKLGKITGDIIKKEEADELLNNLYFELETTNSNSKKSTYPLHLTVTEITEGDSNE